MLARRILRALPYVPTAQAPIALLAMVIAVPRPVLGAQHAVSIVDDAFAPGSLTINVGDTVVWTNIGEHPHTVTADTGAFSSARLDPSMTFSHTFTQAGTFGYRCDFHDGMVGSITVVGAAVPAEAPVAPAGGEQGAGAGTTATGTTGAGTTTEGAAGTTGTTPAGETVPTTSVLHEGSVDGLPLLMLGSALVGGALVLSGQVTARPRSRA